MPFLRIGCLVGTTLGRKSSLRAVFPISGAVEANALAAVGLGFDAMSEQTQVATSQDVAAEDAGISPRTYLVWSALAAALLFLPLGLVALAFSIRTDMLKRRGDVDRARRSSRIALVLVIVTTVVGVFIYLGLIGALLALGAFSGAE